MSDLEKKVEKLADEELNSVAGGVSAMPAAGGFYSHDPTDPAISQFAV